MTSRPCAGCFRISASSSAVSAPGLVQQPIGHADLADVVERREARQQFDALGRQIVAELGMRGELLGERPACTAGFAASGGRFRHP